MTATLDDTNQSATAEQGDTQAAEIDHGAAEAKATASTGTMQRPRTGAYRSGFCGSTSINGVSVTNPERLHRMCRGGSPCSCPCHQGVEVWEGRDELFADAAAGRINEARKRAAKGLKRKR